MLFAVNSPAECFLLLRVPHLQGGHGRDEAVEEGLKDVGVDEYPAGTQTDLALVKERGANQTGHSRVQVTVREHDLQSITF